MDNPPITGHSNDDHVNGEEGFSKIAYTTLTPLEGNAHLIIAQGEGALAVLALAEKVPDDFWSKTHLVYVPDGFQPDQQKNLKALNPRWFYEWSSTNSALYRIDCLLAECKGGVNIYVTGTGSFIGQILQHVAGAGFDPYGTLAERRGPKTRRIQCVHCKGFMDNVATQPVTCDHCGLLLLVRGHYSRRLAAYQGVCINAENPLDVPQTKELFK